MSGVSVGGLAELLRSETRDLVAPTRLSALVGAALPNNSVPRLRTAVLRSCGWQIGRGTIFAGVPVLTGNGALLDRLSIGAVGFVNVGCHWDLNERIVIGDHVSIGHEVLLVTSTHRLGDRRHRAADLDPRPITIGDGVWLGARSTILPGVTIGDGAVVAAGAIVRRDVPPDALAAGPQGEVIRILDP
ncbi:MAG: acyltransferase [Acidimicrobiia bacterium]|nr:acyltransferase [Acidimicrobiia bacterium]